ncbi:MAG: hypothetical protein ACI90V_008633 [Bacillariaceae sp.]|jgi:hypothetical protein
MIAFGLGQSSFHAKSRPYANSCKVKPQMSVNLIPHFAPITPAAYSRTTPRIRLSIYNDVFGRNIGQKNTCKSLQIIK